MKNIHTRPRRTVAALGLLLAITAAHAAPPAPVDSTQRTFAQSVNIAAPLLAQMSAAQTATGGVSATFQALAGFVQGFTHRNEVGRPSFELRFNPQGTAADLFQQGVYQLTIDPSSPVAALPTVGMSAGFFITVTADGIDGRVCTVQGRDGQFRVMCATSNRIVKSTEGVRAGRGWTTLPD